jgi:hypothetical protein
MSLLKNPRHERFCQLVVGGMPATHAYRKVAGPRAGKPENDDVHSHEWARRPDVRARIRELQEENNRKSQLSREEALQWLAAVIKTPVGQVHTDHPLAQSYKLDSDGNLEVRMPSKIEAIALLAKLNGWCEPDRLALSMEDPLKNYLMELRRQPIFSALARPVQRPVLPLTDGQNGREAH